MWLALDTATPTASVALGRPGEVLAQEQTTEPRQHARVLLPMIERVLAAAGVTRRALTGVLVTDGPGSFTGLRIGASVAKALAHSLAIDLWHAPSLLVQAAGCTGDCSGRILSVADALRGEIYAAMYRFPGGRIEVDVEPGVFRPEELVAEVPRPKLLAGRLPPALMASFEVWTATGALLIFDREPEAATLLKLLGHAGGLTRVERDDLTAWEPSYGRPAEAQAQWEKAHGRPLRSPRSS